ncbi:MAG: DUF4292 domain-containing protein [Saprospiraceae bacterium]|nr:DUF4292 domain-containing protein [Saprospiraceae bacterium]
MSAKYIFFLITIFFLFGCKARPKKNSIQQNQDEIELIETNNSKPFSLLKINNLDSFITKNQIPYQLVNAEADIDYSDSEQSISGTMNLRMIKDSIIWVSIQKFGFEGMRAIFRKDSFFIMNRLEKTYIANSIASISDITGISLNIKDLQSVLLGTPTLPFPEKPCFITSKDGYSIEQYSDKKDKFEINWNFIDPDISSIHYKKSTNDIYFNIQQQDYQENTQLNNHKFPNIRKINLVSPKKTFNIDLKFTEIVWNESKKLPFEIPSHYKKVTQF